MLSKLSLGLRLLAPTENICPTGIACDRRPRSGGLSATEARGRARGKVDTARSCRVDVAPVLAVKADYSAGAVG